MTNLSSPSVLTQAHTQWAKRPDDQRFTSLDELLAFSRAQRRASQSVTIGSRKIEARPVINGDTVSGLALVGPDGASVNPTNWAFGQLAQRASAPAAYLRKLPADLAADCINHGLQNNERETMGALIRMNEGPTMPSLAALTGPTYGRIWNSDIIEALVDRFGDGVTGDFTVPGEFSVALDAVNKDNTTLFASDRDMFVFLADEKNRIEIPNRRDGKSGSLARGFFLWNSEVGAASMGISTFLFDYACTNRMVWGAESYQEIRIRHNSGAPDRFLDEITPALVTYANSSAQGITDTIKQAQARKLGDADAVKEFLVNRRRFSQTQAQAINLAHIAEEGRPIETVWDATVGITAYAKGVKHQDARIEIERNAGAILEMAA